MHLKSLLQDETYVKAWKWLKTKASGHWVLIVFLALLILAGLAIIIINTSAWPQWTGLETKTAWDLADLLLVPLVLAIGAFLLNRAQRQSELEIATEERKAERQIAKDREEERALQSYFDTMKELLLEKDLRNSGEGSEVRSVARARTLAVLREVNPARKTSVMRFLIEAELVGADTRIRRTGREQEVYKKLKAHRMHNVINLQNANLHKADLLGADLIGANLHKADLSEAKLSGVDLRRADLIGANLHNTDLHKADLSRANLIRADLSDANLIWAKLVEAELSGAYLHRANLRRADLHKSDLSGADLHRANLFRADLRRADLIGANLHKADLSEAKLSGADLIYAKYNSNTKWPDDFNPEEAGAILED